MISKDLYKQLVSISKIKNPNVVYQLGQVKLTCTEAAELVKDIDAMQIFRGLMASGPMTWQMVKDVLEDATIDIASSTGMVNLTLGGE